MRKITVFVTGLMLGNVGVSGGMNQEALEAVSIIKQHFGTPNTKSIDYEAIKNFDFETPLRLNVDDARYKQRLFLLGGMIGRNIPKEDYIQNLQLFYDVWPAIKATGWSQFADFNVIGGMFAEYPNSKDIASVKNTSVGKLIFLKKNPDRGLLYITDPIALSMLIRLNRIEARKKTDQDFIIQLPRYLRHLDNPETQARVLANFFVNTSLLRAVNNGKYSKRAPVLIRKSLDEAIESCYNSIPWFDGFTLLSQVYFLNRNPFGVKDVYGNVIFDEVIEEIFSDLASSGLNLTELINSFRILHRRILLKITNPGDSTTVPVASVQPVPIVQIQVQQPVQPVQIDPPIVIAQKVYKPLTYAKRVTRWFNGKFTSNKKTSSILYHTLLPQLADPIVVESGVHSEWDNKTTGKKDNLYRMPGKVVNDKGDEKFYIFESCISSDGICYHRGCKNTSFDLINQELDATLNISRELEVDTRDYDTVDEQTAAILEDTDEYAVVNNPEHACKIFLFKIG